MAQNEEEELRRAYRCKVLLRTKLREKLGIMRERERERERERA